MDRSWTDTCMICSDMFLRHLQLYMCIHSEKATGSLRKSSHADHGHEFGANMANQELTKNPHIFMPYDGCEVFYKRWVIDLYNVLS